MGFPVPINSPQFTVGGQTYCVAVFVNGTPIGDMYQAGVFQLVNGGWNNIGGFPVNCTNPNDMVNLVKAKGGMAQFLVWLKAEINKVLVSLFGTAPVAPTTEPTTDADALKQIQAAIAKWSVVGNQVQ